MIAGIIVVTLAIGLILGLAIIETWLVMLLLGVLSAITGWHLAIGFWPVFVVLLILNIIWPGKR